MGEADFMASAERKSILGVWGIAPSGSRGTAPDKGLGGIAPEADRQIKKTFLKHILHLKMHQVSLSKV